RLDLVCDVVDILVRVFAEVPPDNPVVFLLERAKASLSDVDAPCLGGEPEAHVERDRLRADLQHRGQRARILRRLHSKGREVLRGQPEGSSPLERREGSEAWDPNDGRIAKLRMG